VRSVPTEKYLQILGGPYISGAPGLRPPSPLICLHILIYNLRPKFCFALLYLKVEIRNQIRIKKSLWRKYIRNKDNFSWLDYASQRNKVKNIIRNDLIEARTEHNCSTL